MANCNENSYNIRYTDLSKGVLQIQKRELDRERLDIALIGKVRLEYGEVFDENILHLLEHFAAPSLEDEDRPDITKTYKKSLNIPALLSNPTEGQIWYNKTVDKPFVYSSSMDKWLQMGNIDSAAGISGVLAVTSNQSELPLPAANDGYNFDISECVYSVSPFHIPEEIDYFNCFVNDNNKIIFEYRLTGTTLLVQTGFVNYQVLCIKNNENQDDGVGAGCVIGPVPSMTPTPVATMTPTPTRTPGETPAVTPSVTVTSTPNTTPTTTPEITPTPTVTPTVSGSPPVTPSSTPAVTPTSTPPATSGSTPPVTASSTPPVTASSTPPVTPPNTPDVTPSSTPIPLELNCPCANVYIGSGYKESKGDYTTFEACMLNIPVGMTCISSNAQCHQRVLDSGDITTTCETI